MNILNSLSEMKRSDRFSTTPRLLRGLLTMSLLLLSFGTQVMAQVVATCGNPAQASAPVVTYEGVTVSWNDGNAESYTVYWKKNSDSEWSSATGITTTSYTITGLDYGNTYSYKVAAICSGSEQSDPAPTPYSFTTSSEPGLLIYGAVFGGGRMANVTGKTEVVIINCDSISAVYGGNDIAGAVEGNSGVNGSTITLGVNANDTYSTAYNGGAASTKVKIGSVYGGGNGYYAYNGSYFVPASSDYVSQSVEAGFSVKAMTQTHQVGGAVWTNSGSETTTLTFPTIVKTTIFVKNDVVNVDSLFGGAKNAFVTATSDNSTLLNINGGTIFSVFGGNNVGGTLGAGSTHEINVTSTTTYSDLSLTENRSVNLGGNAAYGTNYSGCNAHGIRYLFGGGNKVAAQKVVINVTGGQIDTVFGGGNSADVASTSVTVNVTNPLYDYDHSPYANATTYAYSNTNSVYDIRCLFGGNNAADMAGLPTLNLRQGGVHTVYGGGNKGVMLAASTTDYVDNYARESITPSNTTYNGPNVAMRSTKVVVSSDDFIADTIYGGGQSAGTVHDTYVEIAGGKVGVVYGGTNIMGRIGPATYSYENNPAPRDIAKTNVYIHGGTIYNSVFGASNGYYRCHDGQTYTSGDNILFASADAYSSLAGKQTPAVFKSYVYITSGATILGNVYSSGNMAAVGRLAAQSSGTMDSAGIAILHIAGGTIGAGYVTDGVATITKAGAVYGGGNMGSVYGGSDLRISGTTTDDVASTIIYGDVYGGNDKTGRIFSTLRGNTNVTELASTSSPAAVSAAQTDYPGLPTDITAGSGVSLTDQNASTYTLVSGTPRIYGSLYGGGNGEYTYFDSYTDKATYLTNNTSADASKLVVSCSSTPSADQRSSFVDLYLADGGYVERVFGGGNSKTSGNAALGDGYQTGKVTVFMNCAGNDPTSSADNKIKIGTIFAANNHVAMNIVPRVVMLKGKVGYVYGGGNMGDMTGNEPIGNLPLSTYVVTPSDKVVVANNIYGGCNVADVSNDTYVEMTKGVVLGNIFGGNDLSGEVGIAHVIVNGSVDGGLTIYGNVYGGGNGDYAFYQQVNNSNNAYYTTSSGIVYARATNSEAVSATNDLYCTKNFEFYNMKGRPYVDSAAVVLNGDFSMRGNVYGGGISGDCRKTNVLVDANEGDFSGMIFGAGRGRVDNMGLRIDGTCKALYIGVATGKDDDGNVTYSTSNAMGNVLDTAWLTVRRFHSMGNNNGRSAMFGGGQSGNVGTTVVSYENTATAKLGALYLGCLASDVTNATGVIDAYEPTNGSSIIDTLYGGNDFTGRVDNTNMTINSGVFTHFFGAGNGDYDYKTLIATWSQEGGVLHDDLTTTLQRVGCVDSVPYSMNVNIEVNGGTFLNTVYGGGNMGLVGDRDMVAANMDDEVDDRSDYIGNITLTIHDGTFDRHVFCGARGKTDMKSTFFGLGNTANVDGGSRGKQLAYAHKILNMDGGHVYFSVYGGSEAVDDGFPYECQNKTAGYTTLRPSSILNITGGRIDKSLYGGGYQGNIYGSVYVNIGIDAVRDCKVWTKNYGVTGHTFTMANYKPNLSGHSGYTITNTYAEADGAITKSYVPVTSSSITGNPTLSKDVVDLGASIYNASDWGEAGDKAYFNTRGVFGGETNILVDGKGYYTSLTNALDVGLPSMDIANSLIGAGTSTEGGDVNRLIMLRHYGDYSCPDPSKHLYSIQRADKVVLDSAFIVFAGEQDAFSAYASPNYSFCRIDTLIFRVDNIVMIEAPAIYIGNISSMKTDDVVDITNVNKIYTNTVTAQAVDDEQHLSTVPNDFYDNLVGADDCNANSNPCETYGDVCSKLPSQRGSADHAAAFNVLMMRNGSYVKVYPFVDAHNNTTTSTQVPDGLDDGNHAYGRVFGWMYLLAQDATMSYVYADTKVTGSENPDNDYHTEDGGFVAPCYCDNQGEYTNEIDYINVNAGTDYRTWKVGTKRGSRVRHITLVANATPDELLNHALPAAEYVLADASTNDPVNSGTTISPITIANNSGYAYATTYLELPPSDGGNFYVINSVLIDQDNGGQLNLVDMSYDKHNNRFYQLNNPTTTYTSIASDPDYTFGLTFSSADNFDNSSCWNSTSTLPSVEADGFTRNLADNNGRYKCWKQSLISGNQYITANGGYISNAIVSGAFGSIPTMTFTLLYYTDIHTTITRDVVFTLHEFTSTGDYVGPVEVTVTISTVIKEFSNLEAPVLAMYNEGITNEYVRRVTIPAAFKQRDIYLEGIEWIKDNETYYTSGENPVTVNTDPDKVNWFYMEGYNYTETTGPENNNHFSIIVTPTETASENVNNSLGWYHIASEDGFDVYKTAAADYTATTGVSLTVDQAKEYCSWNYNGNNGVTNMGNHEKGKGLWLGTLDGRSTASVDVALKFNGLYFYHDQFVPPLAWVNLKCHYYNTKQEGDGEFYIKIKVRTRFQGDTIYMAPETTLTRTATDADGGETSLTMHAYGYEWNQGRTETISGPNYSDITSHKTEIKNNPDNYLQDFRQAMLIYDEGDVIDIMKTIPITDGALPITVMGDDYSIIQIIRYSGSHYKFPTLGCANYGPLIEVKNNGILTMRNVWFNGSGCTRTKEALRETSSAHGYHTQVGNNYYYQNHRRVNTLLYAQAPMLYCHGNGNVTFVRNVILSNNFNNGYDRNPSGDAPNANYIGGGAIAVVKESGETTGTPTVSLGDLGHIYDNLVVDWNAAYEDVNHTHIGTSDSLPRNYGGGVYVDAGTFNLGLGSDDTKVTIKRNFYLKNTSNDAGVRTKVAKMFGADDNYTSIEFDVFYLDTIRNAKYFSLSNVYLKRTPYNCSGTNFARVDDQSDFVYFLSQLSEESSVGVSKWFPGYYYHNSRNTEEYGSAHLLNTSEIRDTIAFARVGKGKSNTSMADNNYSANIFFNDSSYFSASIAVADDDPAFFTNATHPAYVTYSGNENGYPNYNDQVFIFRHTSLNPYKIYFQRCGSFRKGVHQELEDEECIASLGQQYNKYVLGDSIGYHWNPDATCAMTTDTLQFHVGGGFFPYTYTWTNITDADNPVTLHTRTTTGSNAISLIGDGTSEYDVLREKAEQDTLVLRLEVESSSDAPEYTYQVDAVDMTGNCPISQEVKVKVVKVASTANNVVNTYEDSPNFLLHNTTEASPWYITTVPGVDSSGFHDHDNCTPTQLTGSIARNTNPSDKTPLYLRLFRSYKISPVIYPASARGTIAVLDADGTNTLYSIDANNAVVGTQGEYCPGEILKLHPTVATNDPAFEYVGWDFDPWAEPTTNFVVSSNEEHNDPVVYYAPGDYWWQVVTSFQNTTEAGNENTATLQDYDLDYYGNVTIKTAKGLAWLISTVNGYNGQNAQTFHFNTITLGNTNTEPIDMSAHKWTPLGNVNNPFEGVFDGNGKHVTNIIVNETTIPLVGMFGHTEGATIKNFVVDATMVRGNTYVSAIVGEATENTLVDNVTIQRGSIFGEYTIGGFISHMVNSTLSNCRLAIVGGDGGIGTIGAYGNAIYAGGLVGHASGSTLTNNAFQNTGYIDISSLSGIYVGAYIGYNEESSGPTPTLGPVNPWDKTKSQNRTTLNNNYARLITSNSVQRVGGMIGYAEDIDMNNNYVYGVIDYDKQGGFMGGIAGLVGNNVSISNCYFVDGMAENMIGYNTGSAPQKSTTFKGSGNQVILTEPVDGFNNLTRALNKWVQAQDDTTYNTWRSDLEGVNSGYPVFGDPDMIPVFDTLQTASCYEYEFDDLLFTESGNYVFHVVDSADFLDSTFTLMLTINYGDSTAVSDTVDWGEAYEGFGFSLTAEQLTADISNRRNAEIYALQFVDSLLNANGCDSVVTLTLYVVKNGVDVPEVVQQLSDVKVYPNPTRGVLHVEGSGLQRVETYDASGKKVGEKIGDNAVNSLITIDLHGQASGAYYLRVLTTNGTVVKKVIKK